MPVTPAVATPARRGAPGAALAAEDAAPALDAVAPEVQAGALLRLFAALVERWRLPVADAMQLLGLTQRSSYYHLLTKARAAGPGGGVAGVSPDLFQRLSHLANIAAALRVLFPNSAEDREAFVTRPNTAPVFGGEPPLALMRGGIVGLWRMQAYLDAARGY